jgi:hypothetical protein
MADVLTALGALVDWFFVQPLPIRVAVGLGLLLAAYVVSVILRVTFAALYAAFRGLG